MTKLDVKQRFDDLAALLVASRDKLAPAIDSAARAMIEALENGNKILVCGNGGSAADAQHFAAELVGRFHHPNRRALAAIALTTDSSVLTSVSNDCGYDNVFARQIEALARPGDVVIVISTSGRSKNVITALDAARAAETRVISLTGAAPNAIAELADIAICVPSTATPRIQEVHELALHTMTEAVDAHFAGHA